MGNIQTFDNLDRVFYLKDVSFDKVIIKMIGDSSLYINEYPFLDSHYDYFTVTRGKEHDLIITFDDGTICRIHWGLYRNTQMDNMLSTLQAAIIQFIQDNDIILDYNGGIINEAIILYNNAYGKWSLALYSNKDNCFIFSDTASSAQDMIEECKKYIIAEWEHNDQNGFESWKAKNFKILLK